jgi:hypothetical protein
VHCGRGVGKDLLAGQGDRPPRRASNELAATLRFLPMGGGRLRQPRRAPLMKRSVLRTVISIVKWCQPISL